MTPHPHAIRVHCNDGYTLLLCTCQEDPCQVVAILHEAGGQDIDRDGLEAMWQLQEKGEDHG